MLASSSAVRRRRHGLRGRRWGSGRQPTTGGVKRRLRPHGRAAQVEVGTGLQLRKVPDGGAIAELLPVQPKREPADRPVDSQMPMLSTC